MLWGLNFCLFVFSQSSHHSESLKDRYIHILHRESANKHNSLQEFYIFTFNSWGKKYAVDLITSCLQKVGGDISNILCLSA